MRLLLACAFLIAWSVVVFAEEAAIQPNREAKADKLATRVQPNSTTDTVYAPVKLLPEAMAKQNLFKYKWRSHQ
jgi:hypothetical protein